MEEDGWRGCVEEMEGEEWMEEWREEWREKVDGEESMEKSGLRRVDGEEDNRKQKTEKMRFQ